MTTGQRMRQMSLPGGAQALVGRARPTAVSLVVRGTWASKLSLGEQLRTACFSMCIFFFVSSVPKL